MDQKPIEGISMVYTFDDPDAESKRETQYFEMVRVPHCLFMESFECD